MLEEVTIEEITVDPSADAVILSAQEQKSSGPIIFRRFFNIPSSAQLEEQFTDIETDSKLSSMPASYTGVKNIAAFQTANDEKTAQFFAQDTISERRAIKVEEK